MSKKYKGKNCVYCGGSGSTSSDHVIAREFFPVERRQGLPKVPSCDKCNGLKSDLEHYATTLLPFGSKTLFAKSMLTTYVPPRLGKNKKIKKELTSGLQRIWVNSDSGLMIPILKLPLHEAKLIELYRMIIRGMAFHHWSIIIPQNYFVDVYSVTIEGLKFFRNNILSDYPKNYYYGNIGDGCFLYGCTRSSEDSGISAWEMTFYSGVTIVASSNSGKFEQQFFCGLTGPEEC